MSNVLASPGPRYGYPKVNGSERPSRSSPALMR